MKRAEQSVFIPGCSPRVPDTVVTALGDHDRRLRIMATQSRVAMVPSTCPPSVELRVSVVKTDLMGIVIADG